MKFSLLLLIILGPVALSKVCSTEGGQPLEHISNKQTPKEVLSETRHRAKSSEYTTSSRRFKRLANILLSYHSPVKTRKPDYTMKINGRKQKNNFSCTHAIPTSFGKSCEQNELNMKKIKPDNGFQNKVYNKKLRWDLPKRNRIHSFDNTNISMFSSEKLCLSERIACFISPIGCKDCNSLILHDKFSGFIETCRSALLYEHPYIIYLK